MYTVSIKCLVSGIPLEDEDSWLMNARNSQPQLCKLEKT